jgi:hypothetical protein
MLFYGFNFTTYGNTNIASSGIVVTVSGSPCPIISILEDGSQINCTASANGVVIVTRFGVVASSDSIILFGSLTPPIIDSVSKTNNLQGGDIIYITGYRFNITGFEVLVGGLNCNNLIVDNETFCYCSVPFGLTDEQPLNATIGGTPQIYGVNAPRTLHFVVGPSITSISPLIVKLTVFLNLHQH